MHIKYIFDTETQQPVYAICDSNHQCGLITTHITTAIKAGQCKSFDEVKTLIAK